MLSIEPNVGLSTGSGNTHAHIRACVRAYTCNIFINYHNQWPGNKICLRGANQGQIPFGWGIGKRGRIHFNASELCRKMHIFNEIFYKCISDCVFQVYQNLGWGELRVFFRIVSHSDVLWNKSFIFFYLILFVHLGIRRMVLKPLGLA